MKHDEPNVFLDHVHFALGEDVNPLSGGELFDTEVHSLLKNTIASDDWYAFPKHEEVGVPHICETNIVCC